MIRKWSFILMLMVAAVCAACRNTHNGQMVVEAGAFTIVREQHSSRQWNTGGTTTYHSFDVSYRKREFQFPGLRYSGSSGGQVTEIASSRIHYASVISQSPAALLVVAGDLNNDASWYLLVDMPGGLHAEHVAFYTTYSELAWLDGDVPVAMSDRRELLKIEGGRWLWVGSQSLLDLDSLEVHRLLSIGGSRDGALFVAFSPDRRKMARYDSSMDPNNFRVWYPLILENDIESGAVRHFDIDRRTMWFDDSRDIDRAWLESYFEWRKKRSGGFALHPMANPKLRVYHGRLEVETDTNAVQYHVPRLRFKHRRAAMDFIAGVVGGKHVVEEIKPYAEEPTAATAKNDDGATVTVATMPPSIGPLASMDLDVEGKTLTVYFTERGLAIENHDPALNGVVRKIAEMLDAEFASPMGQTWIADESPDP